MALPHKPKGAQVPGATDLLGCWGGGGGGLHNCLQHDLAACFSEVLRKHLCQPYPSDGKMIKQVILQQGISLGSNQIRIC